MASEHVPTMNLFDDGEGMVPLQTQDKPSTAFKPPEKNMSTNKDTMDSTPINDVMMMEPPRLPRIPGYRVLCPKWLLLNLKLLIPPPTRLRRRLLRAKILSTSPMISLLPSL